MSVDTTTADHVTLEIELEKVVEPVEPDLS